MMTKTVLAALVLCAVCVNSEDPYGRLSRTPDYVRIKRAKYYSSPPMRFYRRPPIPQPVKGIFSYTPPPNYMEHDDPYTGNFKPKVSKRPTTNNGLEDEDLNNIVKHLSKQDLDKIIEFAGEKYRESPFQKYSTPLNKLPIDEASANGFKTSVQEMNADQKFLLNGPFVSNVEHASYDMDYRDHSRPPINNVAPRPFSEPDHFSFRGSLANPYNSPNDHYNNVQNAPSKEFYDSPPTPNSPQDLTEVPLRTEESMHSNQFSFVDSFINQELYGAASMKSPISTFTDSETEKEEQLPKPLNLREDQDYQLASTNNVPTVVKSSSYKVESFGDLPLMDYNSKRDSVSSYHVPHYSVVSSSHHQASPPSSPPYAPPSSSSQLVPSPAAAAIKAPRFEPAPPVSAAKEQSDAHLKAIKIWTHQSKGTAYTLHDDGTLSLERPERPKAVYGQ